MMANTALSIMLTSIASLADALQKNRAGPSQSVRLKLKKRGTLINHQETNY